MGWLNKIREILKIQPAVNWPNDKHQSRLDVMVELLEDIAGDKYGYALFESDRSMTGSSVTIVDNYIIMPEDELIDLTSLAMQSGEYSLGKRLAPVPTAEQPMNELFDASPLELAKVVDLIFRYHYQLPEDYPLFGYAMS